MNTIIIPSTDGINVYGDLYLNEVEDAPIILLCHQAGYSRGEYAETATKLLAQGFSCLAIDQRSGNEINGVENKTAREAYALKLPQAYVDALPDINAAVDYLIEAFPISKKIILGSSYSSSLVLIVAAKYGAAINAVVSFSPGEYFKYQNKSIQDWASIIEIPVFISSAKGEVSAWQAIFDGITRSQKTKFIPEGTGQHGSKTLWESNTNSQEYWSALNDFLKAI